MLTAHKYPSSYTMQAYYAVYLLNRRDFLEASFCFSAAALVYHGNSRYLVVMAAECAALAGRHDVTAEMLNPYLPNAKPDENKMDRIIVALVSNALNKNGEFARALEVASRLPFKGQNLDEVLLLGLSSRAEAKIGLRLFAEAKRDLAKICATDPEFDTIEELESLLKKAAADCGDQQNPVQEEGKNE